MHNLEPSLDLRGIVAGGLPASVLTGIAKVQRSPQ